MTSRAPVGSSEMQDGRDAVGRVSITTQASETEADVSELLRRRHADLKRREALLEARTKALEKDTHRVRRSSVPSAVEATRLGVGARRALFAAAGLGVAGLAGVALRAQQDDGDDDDEYESGGLGDAAASSGGSAYAKTLQKQLHVLKAAVGREVCEKDGLKEALVGAKADQSKLRQELGHVKTMLESTQRNFRKQKTAAMINMHAAQRALAEQRDAESKLQRSKDQLKLSDIKRRDAKRDELKQSLDESEKKCTDLEQKLKQSEQQWQGARDRAKRLEAELRNAKQEKETCFSETKITLSQRTDQLDRLVVENDKLKSERTTYERQNRKLQRELEEAREGWEQEKKEKGALVTQVKCSEAEIGFYKETKERHEAEIRTLRQQKIANVDECERKLIQEQAKTGTLQDDIFQLRNKLLSKENDVNRLRGELDDERYGNKSSGPQIRQLQDENSVLQSQLERLSRSNKFYGQKEKELQRQLEKAQSEALSKPSGGGGGGVTFELIEQRLRSLKNVSVVVNDGTGDPIHALGNVFDALDNWGGVVHSMKGLMIQKDGTQDLVRRASELVDVETQYSNLAAMLGSDDVAVAVTQLQQSNATYEEWLRGLASNLDVLPPGGGPLDLHVLKNAFEDMQRLGMVYQDWLISKMDSRLVSLNHPENVKTMLDRYDLAAQAQMNSSPDESQMVAFLQEQLQTPLGSLLEAAELLQKLKNHVAVVDSVSTRVGLRKLQWVDLANYSVDDRLLATIDELVNLRAFLVSTVFSEGEVAVSHDDLRKKVEEIIGGAGELHRQTGEMLRDVFGLRDVAPEQMLAAVRVVARSQYTRGGLQTIADRVNTMTNLNTTMREWLQQSRTFDGEQFRVAMAHLFQQVNRLTELMRMGGAGYEILSALSNVVDRNMVPVSLGEVMTDAPDSGMLYITDGTVETGSDSEWKDSESAMSYD